jgi:hypothetical protein
MKFLVWAKPSQTMQPPPDQMPALLRGFQDSIRQQLNDHTLDCCYAYGQAEGFGILEVNSIEEAWEKTMQNPLAPFWDIDIRHLGDPIAMTGIQLRAIEAMSTARAGAR